MFAGWMDLLTPQYANSGVQGHDTCGTQLLWESEPVKGTAAQPLKRVLDAVLLGHPYFWLAHEVISTTSVRKAAARKILFFIMVDI